MSDLKPALGRLEAKMLARGSSAVSTGDNLAFKLLPNGRLLAAVAASAVHEDGLYEITEQRHALAALALHGQEFGFTREDVEVLRKLTAGFASTDGNTRAGSSLARLVRSLADRIEALLPPEQP